MLGTLWVHREVRAQLAHVHLPSLAPVHAEPARAMEVVELSQVPPLGVEDLNAVIFPVCDVHEPVGVRGDVVREVEAAGIGPRLTPREQMPAPGIVLVNARVPVPIRDEEIPGRGGQRDVGGPVERLAPLERGGLVGVADREEEFALGSELADRVVAVVGEPH